MSEGEQVPLDAAAICTAISDLPGWTAEVLPRTDSTNDDARQRAVAGAPHGTAVFADWQAAGRGRRGSAWIAPPRRCLLGSVVLRPGLAPEKWTRLTHACALAVCDVLDAQPDMPRAELKWPNDVHVSGRKICGILVESAFHAAGAFAVAGVGVNLNLTEADFPADLRPAATSVWLERGGRQVDRAAFAAEFLRRLQYRVSQAETDWPSLRQEAAGRCLLTGRRVSLLSMGQEIRGEVTGLGPEGELLLSTGEGVRMISSADLVRPENSG